MIPSITRAGRCMACKRTVAACDDSGCLPDGNRSCEGAALRAYLAFRATHAVVPSRDLPWFPLRPLTLADCKCESLHTWDTPG
jgi:hypothetical protein